MKHTMNGVFCRAEYTTNSSENYSINRSATLELSEYKEVFRTNGINDSYVTDTNYSDFVYCDRICDLCRAFYKF